MKRILAVSLLLLLLVATMTACNKTTAFEKSNSASSDTTVSSDASADATTAGLTIAYSSIADADEAPWAGTLWDALESVCKENDWTFTALSADGVSATQDQQIDTLLAEDPDYFVIFAGDCQMADEWVEKIHNAGIPVIMAGIDASASSAEYVSAFVGADQEALAGQLAMDMITDNGADAALNVVTISGFEAQEDYRLREQGFEKTLSYFSNYTLLANDYAGASKENAKDIMSTYLDTYGDTIDVVVCYDAEFAEGALEAIEEAGLSDSISIYTIVGSSDVLTAIQDGSIVETALLSATDIAEQCADVITGLETGTIPNHYNYTERTYVTIDNVSEYLNNEDY